MADAAVLQLIFVSLFVFFTNMILVIKIRSQQKLILPYMAFDVEPENTFKDVYDLASAGIQSCESQIPEKVYIKDNMEKSGGVLVTLSLKISICDELKSKFVDFLINLPSHSSSEEPVCSSSSTNSDKNVFDFMMASRKTLMFPEKPTSPDFDKTLTGPQKLFCDVLDWCKTIDDGWSRDQLICAKEILWKITNCLWYVDTHHDKFKTASCAIPKCFQAFQGYNRVIELHKKAPTLSVSKLECYSADLTKCLSFPCMAATHHKTLSRCTEMLLECIVKYMDRLKNDNKRHKSQYHARLDSALNVANDSSCSLINSKKNVDEVYHDLNVYMGQKDPYEYVSLDVFSPEDKEVRRKYVKNLALSMPIMLFRIAYGNSIGTLNFVWVISGDSQHQIEMNSRTVLTITESLPKYANRGMRKDFINRYATHLSIPKSVLRHMYHSLTNCISNPSSINEGEVDARVAELLLSGDDTQILLDHRSLNGRPIDEKFGTFFDEVSKYFEEQVLSVQERRHGDELYLPLAISIEDLKQSIIKRLPEGTSVPSNETLRLQFMPNNPFEMTSLKYTGRFNVKFRVQVRQSRIFHEDSHYVAATFKYLKELSVKLKDFSLFLCMDDKAIIPIGEPGVPISTGVRGHHKAMVPSDGPRLVCTDHDFHVGGIVPSVTLITEIPDNANDSFFNGQIFVTSKDKVFQASNPFRHTAELTRILREHHSEDDVNINKPILFILTDGGPDHRVTYETVKVAMVQLFMQLDIDFLICIRTAPNHSWLNPAERCMSILNLALQHVALSRAEMSTHFETMIKNKSTLKAVRDLAESNKPLKDAFEESMSGVIKLVNERFERMKLKGNQLITYSGMSDDSIQENLDIIKTIIHEDCADDIDMKINSKELRKYKELQEFIRIHGVSTHYSFQLKKCKVDSDCSYCTINPHCLPEEVFNNLHFLPCPVPDESGLKYKSLDELYGNVIDESHRPSAKVSGFKEDDVNYDKQHRELFKTIKVRDHIKCGECNKPRLIFSHQKLSREQDNSLARMKNEAVYVCGNKIEDGLGFVTKSCLTCSTDIETSYYSCKISFSEVCCYCGTEENLIDQYHPYMCELYEQFSFVRPLCEQCKNKGLLAKTWGKKFFRKRHSVD